MYMTVSFRSEWEQVAGQLFERAFLCGPFDDVAETVQVSLTGSQANYLFESDAMLRDVRSWGADALGCGLITSFSVVVE